MMRRSEIIWRPWRRIRAVVTALMLVAVLLVLWKYVAGNWAEIRAHDWVLNLPWLVAAALAMAGFHAGLAMAWHRFINWSGGTTAWPVGLWVWSLSSAARYLPTPIWGVGARIYLTKKLGVSWRSATVGYVGDVVGSLCGAFAISLLALSILVSLPPVIYYAIVAATTLLALPLGYLLALKLLTRLNVAVRYNLAALAGWSTQYSVSFVVFGIGYILVLQSLGIQSPPVHVVVGVSALAWGVGTLNVLSPSGIGTREIILVLGLQQYLSAPELISLSVLSRLAAVAGELLLFTLAYALNAGHRRVPPIPVDAGPSVGLGPSSR